MYIPYGRIFNLDGCLIHAARGVKVKKLDEIPEGCLIQFGTKLGVDLLDTDTDFVPLEELRCTNDDGDLQVIPKKSAGWKSLDCIVREDNLADVLLLDIYGKVMPAKPNSSPSRFVAIIAYKLHTIPGPKAVPVQEAPVAKQTPANAEKFPHYFHKVDATHIDVYWVLDKFNTGSAAIDHAVKKLLAPGQRGAKSRIKDLREAIASIERAIEMEGGE